MPTQGPSSNPQWHVTYYYTSTRPRHRKVANAHDDSTARSPRSGVYAVSFTGRMMPKWAAATQFPIPPGVMSYLPHT